MPQAGLGAGPLWAHRESSRYWSSRDRGHLLPLARLPNFLWMTFTTVQTVGGARGGQ